jgi:hypothetical protein
VRRFAGELLARRCERDVAAVPREQRCAEFVFELADLP